MLTDLIREAGVVGEGGAGFPTHIKLDAKSDFFIVNAAECEPLIETDKYICRMFASEIIEAMQHVGEHLGAKRLVIALKRKYNREINALTDAIRDKGANIELFLMDSFYPAGDEQVLVQMITGRSVPERGIPLAVGAVVNNVGTMVSIQKALKGIPVTEKHLSVTGDVERPMMLKVPLGAPIIDCINAAKPNLPDYDIVLGGPMMGKVYTEPAQIAALSVEKTVGNILILPKGHHLYIQAQKPLHRIIRQAQSACLQCRFCTDQCPRYRVGHRVRPHLVMRAIFLEQRVENAMEYEHLYGDAANCSECGLCDMYSCPMGLSPRRVNMYLKGRLREKGIDVPKNPTPKAREALFYGKASTDRLIRRLGIYEYSLRQAGDECLEIEPKRVMLPFLQHIGKPAIPLKAKGDRIAKGDLLGLAAEGPVSANIHASIDGIVESIDERCAVIEREGWS